MDNHIAVVAVIANGSPPIWRDAVEGEGLGDGRAGHLGDAVEVGDRVRDPQHPVIAARREVHALGGGRPIARGAVAQSAVDRH